jgi:hypothetical protein
MDDKKLSREQAEAIAAELLAHEPRFRDARLAKWAGLAQALVRLGRMQTAASEERPSPFVSPASPAWGIVHRETDTTKQG